MPTNLILNSINFNDATLTNGKTYYNEMFACNYPLNQDITFEITATVGSKYITANSGLLNLLGGDIQNNNTPVYSWIMCAAGEILEVDYVISDTSAVLKLPSSYLITASASFAIDYYVSPMVAQSIVTNTKNTVASGVLVNNNIGPLSVNIGIGRSIFLGSNPISVDLGSTGADCQLTVKYSE